MMEREELLRASAGRHSVRAYDGLALTDEDRTYLEARIAAINAEAGLHIQLACGEPDAFDSLLAHYGKFSGVVNYLVLAGPDTPGLDELCGYWGEMLVLEAQARGMRTCWVGGTFSKRKTKYTCAKGERLSLIVSLGYGTTDGRPHPVKKTAQDVAQVPVGVVAPEWFAAGVEEALLAPTAMHQQKFRFELCADGEHVRATTAAGPFAKVDLGIAKLHFELGSGKDASVWE
ncbi:MAG: nitroreductase [Eggerthellaceae bacterium]|nr:nitroreductase [Eggerthellaceae bacterium]